MSDELRSKSSVPAEPRDETKHSTALPHLFYTKMIKLPHYLLLPLLALSAGFLQGAPASTPPASQPPASNPVAGLPLRLTAAQASGGVLNADGTAVVLSAAMDTKAEVRWAFPAPLEAGAWRVTVAFDGKTKGAKNQVFGFVSERTPLVDCYSLNTNGTQSFVLVTIAPASGLFYRKTSQRNQDTAGIKSVVIDRVATPAPGERWCLDVNVAAGAAVLPFPLAPGNFKVVAAKPVVLTWDKAAGGAFTTPSSATTFAECIQPLTRLGVVGEATTLTIERYPSVPVPAMDVPPGELITVVDPAKKETRTLTLVGAPSGAPAPALALFPGGKKHAIFTTWDDGQLADLTVAALLKKHGFRGTFVMNSGSKMMGQLGDLEALGMEVGSHSWSHPSYHLSGAARCLAESVQMRKKLEALLGHPVISFAYPFGYQPAYDEQGDYVLRSLEAAGYWFARTTAGGPNRIDTIKHPLKLSADTHFNGGGDRITKRFNELSKEDGTVFHVWGHSYELAGTGEATLEAVLAGIGGRPDVWYTTGGEVFVWRWMRQNTVFAPVVKTANAAGETSFTVTQPWLHSYLRKLPLTVRVPAGVTEVVWNGARQPVQDGLVELVW
jgi:peptidoglycan/xylan/chitin deacetylase (PgdA/CDA1 family)